MSDAHSLLNGQADTHETKLVSGQGPRFPATYWDCQTCEQWADRRLAILSVINNGRRTEDLSDLDAVAQSRKTCNVCHQWYAKREKLIFADSNVLIA